MSREMTRQQVMNWRDGWSSSDRALIESSLDLLPEADYYKPTSAQYIGARVGGRVAVYIAAGYLYWPKGRWAVDLDPQLVPGGLKTDDEGHKWFPLSTFRTRAGAKERFEELSAPCPDCFLVPSVSGECGCD